MLAYVLIFVAVVSLLGVVRLAVAGVRSQRYLEGAAQDRPLALEHLTGPLRTLAQETRLLRVSLEAPVRATEEFLRGSVDRSAESVESYDAMLMNATRQIADWAAQLRRLPRSDRERLRDLGVDVDDIEGRVERGEWAFDRWEMQRAGAQAQVRLHGVMGTLARVEEALQVQRRLYR